MNLLQVGLENLAFIIIQGTIVVIRLHQTLLLVVVLLHILIIVFLLISCNQYKNGIHAWAVEVLACVLIAKVKANVGMVIVTRIVLPVMVICIANNVTVRKAIILLFIDNTIPHSILLVEVCMGKFKFTVDYRLLNIETEDGRIYVYKRCSPPSSVTTCSLIRKRGSSSSNSGTYSPSFPNNGYGGGYTTSKGSSSFSQRQNTTPSHNQPTKHTCSLCNGQRRIVKDTYPSLYGQSDYQIKCNECGGYFMRSIGHTHTTCPQCHGKGYFTTN